MTSLEVAVGRPGEAQACEQPVGEGVELGGELLGDEPTRRFREGSGRPPLARGEPLGGGGRCSAASPKQCLGSKWTWGAAAPEAGPSPGAAVVAPPEDTAAAALSGVVEAGLAVAKSDVAHEPEEAG